MTNVHVIENIHLFQQVEDDIPSKLFEQHLQRIYIKSTFLWYQKGKTWDKTKHTKIDHTMIMIIAASEFLD